MINLSLICFNLLIHAQTVWQSSSWHSNSFSWRCFVSYLVSVLLVLLTFFQIIRVDSHNWHNSWWLSHPSSHDSGFQYLFASAFAALDTSPLVFYSRCLAPQVLQSCSPYKLRGLRDLRELGNWLSAKPVSNISSQPIFLLLYALCPMVAHFVHAFRKGLSIQQLAKIFCLIEFTYFPW